MEIDLIRLFVSQTEASPLRYKLWMFLLRLPSKVLATTVAPGSIDLRSSFLTMAVQCPAPVTIAIGCSVIQ